MSFRDDHDAALARAAALEKELADARADDVDRDRKLADIERELATERARAAAAERELAKLKPRPPSRVQGQMTAMFVAIGAGLVLVVAVVIVVLSSSARSPSKQPFKPVDWVTPAFEHDHLYVQMLEMRARGGRLVAMWLDGVRRDGTLDPVKGSLSMTFYKGGKCTSLKRDAKGDMPVADGSCDPAAYRSREELALRCSTRTIWKQAIAAGASPDALGKMELIGTTWRFEITDPRYAIARTFEDNCQQ